MAPETEQRIIQDAMRSGMPLPKKIQNAPEVKFGLSLYYNAFFELNTTRPMGMGGIAPIPWTSIRDYCIVYELDDEQTESMFYLIREMDNTFIKFMDNKAKSSTKTGRKKFGKS